LNITIDLLQGVALLLALSLLQSFVIRLWPWDRYTGQVASGLVFGGLCVVGMMMPLELAPGLIFDARSVIVTMAAAFGGLLVGGISALIAIAYRLWLGGAGAVVGVYTILIAFTIGLAFHQARRRGLVKCGIPMFFGLGLVVHALSLATFTRLEPVLPPQALESLALPYLLILSSATALLGVLLLDTENRHNTEKALLLSEERYRAAYDSVPIAMVETDEKGTILAFNRVAEEMYGCRAEDVVGTSMTRFMTDEQLAEVEGDLSDYLREQLEPNVGRQVEVTGKRANGELFPALAGTGIMRVGEERRFIGLISDQTAMKALEAKLMRAQKMEAVGQLTGGIAHDFNNILGIVLGNLEILGEMTGDNPAAGRRVVAALKGARRGAAITRKLLNFSRQAPSEARSIDVNDVLRGMYPLVSRSLTASIELDAHLERGLWPVVADPGDLQDAMLNLALNARDAMPEGGKLIVETANAVLEGGMAGDGADVPPGDYVSIAISDTGSGMRETVRAAAFEPFFSTKEEGRGSGLGLSMVYGFVRRSRGRVDIYSEPGKGTTVRICLPRAGGGEARSAAPAPEAALPGGNETILVVDDEAALAEIATVNLSALGYRVLQAADAGEALGILEGSEGIDLLFSDIILPGPMDGYRLAAEVRKRWPHIRILVTSGFSKRREETMQGDSADSLMLARRLLHKPYTRAELAGAVRRALDREAPAGTSILDATDA
jgi:PAS domain S-box-containing protein